jgi:glycosyltransferase involved in cell wall biosynthesis
MPRLLIVHYHFLPVHNVAVKRLVGYARHLPAHGWDPLVLTRHWRGLGDADPSWGLSWEPAIEARERIPIHRVTHSPRERRMPRAADPWPIRKTLSLWHMLADAYPDEFIDWATPAVEAARVLSRHTPIDAVLTYCPPETNLVIGSRLARILGVPWIPFFGDLYGFFLAPLSTWSPASMIRRRYHHYWLAAAAGCLSASPYMAEYLARTYGKPSGVVLTGFEPGEFASAPDTPMSRDTFVVSHVGSLYPGNQRPEIFFDGIDRLLAAHPDIGPRLEVRMIGSKCDAHVQALVAGRPAAQVTRILPKVPSTAVVQCLTDSHALLAFNCTAHRTGHGTMSYPTKVFEAFGARRPVLAIPPDGDWMDALLARTAAGTSAGDPQTVAAILWDWFSSWSAGDPIPYGASADTVAAFTVGRQTARLADFLRQVTSGRATVR